MTSTSFVPSVITREPIEPDRAIADALDGLLTDHKGPNGRRLLAYAPDDKLRSALQIRQFKVGAALSPAMPADLAQAVAQMLLGFGTARAHDEDAAAIVTQYVTELSDLPLWAVQRACHRFGKGNVTKAEAPDWRRSYPPSTAELCHLAENMVQSYRREEKRIAEALKGIPIDRPTSEERDRVLRGLADLKSELGKSDDPEATRRADEARLRQPISIKTAASSALKRALKERAEFEELRVWSG